MGDPHHSVVMTNSGMKVAGARSAPDFPPKVKKVIGDYKLPLAVKLNGVCVLSWSGDQSWLYSCLHPM